MYIILIVCVVIALYFYGTRTFGYWKRKGVLNETPLPFVGNNLDQFLLKASMCMMYTRAYNKYPSEKVVGFFTGTTPNLIIRDPELMKRVLVTDFQHFYDRGFNPHKTVLEPLLQNLFFANGDLWRLLRHGFTPAFSTSKLKNMFPLITERAEKLQLLAEELTNKDFYDMRELMARYVIDFIGVCGFGINMDTLNDENSKFKWLAKRIFARNFRDGIIGALKFIFPEICKNLHFMTPELELTINQLVKRIMEDRNYMVAGKHDFIDLLLEFKQKGKIATESIEKKQSDGSPKIVEIELTDLLLTAQVFVFFAAGFETSSTTSSHTLHQLAFNPDCQEKVQQEIDRVLAKYDNKLSYDAINEMKYLEMAFYEGMRMYPSVGYLLRQCTSKTYTFPEINLTIEEGMKVFMPIQAMFKDERYFDKPDHFIPERFQNGVKDKKNGFVPFGDGPRACVGLRLGLMQSMAGIAAILQKYTVEPAACSKRNPDPEPTGMVTEGFINGLPLKLKKRHL